MGTFFRERILQYYQSDECKIKTRKQLALEIGCTTETVNRYGRELGIKNKKNRTPTERFAFFTNKNGPIPVHNTDLGQCWEWLGDFSDDGYGKFKFNKKTWRSNRFAYYLHFRIIDESLLVCHKCHNKKCVNPSHLYQGTVKDNSRDSKIDKIGDTSGTKNPKCKLSEEDVLFIRNNYHRNDEVFGVTPLAKRFSVTQSCIRSIVTGKTWKTL